MNPIRFVVVVGVFFAVFHAARSVGEGYAAEPMATRVLWDVAYSPATDRAGLCDIYLPEYPDDQWRESGGESSSPISLRVEGASRPAVILVHGGGWVSGDKWVQGGFAKAMAQSGMCVMNINYRLAPQHVFPAAVDDVRQALLFLSRHADQLSIDTDRIGLFGYSAGAHLSCLVAVMSDEPGTTRTLSSAWPVDDPRWSQMPPILCVCGGGTPCDFRDIPPDSRALAYFLGGSQSEVPDNYIGASPAAHVSPGDPPIRLIHGDKDIIVPIEGSRVFLAGLRSAGVDSELTIVEGEGHLVTFLHPKTKTTVLDYFREKFGLAKP